MTLEPGVHVSKLIETYTPKGRTDSLVLVVAELCFIVALIYPSRGEDGSREAIFAKKTQSLNERK